METVYVVTQGSYSDYRMIAAFSEHARAEAYASELRESGVIKFKVDSPPQVWWEIEVTMFQDGEVLLCSEPEAQTSPPHRVQCAAPVFSNMVNGKVHMSCSFSTKDKTQAVKSANEIRTRLLAFDLWPKDGQDSTHLPVATRLAWEALGIT